MTTVAPTEQLAYIGLRNLLLAGEIRPGERLSEVKLAERLGMSRTPIRWALIELEHSGLVESAPSGGFVARRFTPREVEDAMVVRGTLEGLAARLAAERRLDDTVRLELRALLVEAERLLEADPMGSERQQAYASVNDRFHRAIAHASRNDALIRAIENNSRLPFASPSAMLPLEDSTPDYRFWLRVSHEQHQTLLEAIEAREGTRAQALAEEHARLGRRSLVRAVKSPGQLEHLWPALSKSRLA